MSKNIFKSKYVGPQGKHLSYLTQTTMTGSYEEAKQRSIHSMRKGRKGTNTCAARNPNRKGKLAKASAELDRRRRAFGAMPPADQAACTMPGSMSY